MSKHCFKKYLKAWLFSLKIGFNISITSLYITIFNFHFHIDYDRALKETDMNFSISFPKYALIITNEDSFFYNFKNYSFFRKELVGYLKFFVLHVIGNNAEKIYEPNSGSELYWSDKWRN